MGMGGTDIQLRSTACCRCLHAGGAAIAPSFRPRCCCTNHSLAAECAPSASSASKTLTVRLAGSSCVAKTHIHRHEPCASQLASKQLQRSRALTQPQRPPHPSYPQPRPQPHGPVRGRPRCEEGAGQVEGQQRGRSGQEPKGVRWCVGGRSCSLSVWLLGFGVVYSGGRCSVHVWLTGIDD